MILIGKSSTLYATVNGHSALKPRTSRSTVAFFKNVTPARFVRRKIFPCQIFKGEKTYPCKRILRENISLQGSGREKHCETLL